MTVSHKDLRKLSNRSSRAATWKVPGRRRGWSRLGARRARTGEWHTWGWRGRFERNKLRLRRRKDEHRRATCRGRHHPRLLRWLGAQSRLDASLWVPEGWRQAERRRPRCRARRSLWSAVKFFFKIWQIWQIWILINFFVGYFDPKNNLFCW